MLSFQAGSMSTLWHTLLSPPMMSCSVLSWLRTTLTPWQSPYCQSRCWETAPCHTKIICCFLMVGDVPPLCPCCQVQHVWFNYFLVLSLMDLPIPAPTVNPLPYLILVSTQCSPSHTSCTSCLSHIHILLHISVSL